MAVVYKNKRSERSARWNRENPEKFKILQRRYLETHRDEINARHRERYRVCKDEADRIKRAAGCAKCGMSDPRCLDFHHTEPGTKSWTVGRWQNSCLSPEAIRAEAKKCEVLCANCHRIHHAEERKRGRSI